MQLLIKRMDVWQVRKSKWVVNPEAKIFELMHYLYFDFHIVSFVDIACFLVASVDSVFFIFT